ncbi:MAG: methionyl-tRNA formyltransferase [Betaproteobacteria bacterium]|nr:MAG: methionyl-tRNA formyltransferase [Betaproteobacteria bacterium]TAG83914.1 MAG: methionyl-tRNA formyltransferase [Betaproteobacteria bacterium]
MRVVFAGTPEFAAFALKAIAEAGFDVVAVYTQPDRPAGRGMKLTASAVKVAAASRSIPVLQPVSLKPAEAQAQLAALKPDVMVVAAYGLILPQAVLDIPTYGCINIHASLLPRWRGAAPIHRAVEAGDAETGVCIMQMEAGLDTGPVLSTRHTEISALDTTGSVHDRLAALGATAVVEVLRAIASGHAPTPQIQPSEGVTYAHKISSDEARIDWRQPADAIDRKIRAFNPAPGAWTMWRGEKLKVWAATVVTSDESSIPPQPDDRAIGRVQIDESGRTLIRCGSQSLALSEVQRAGSKRMSAVAWRAGSQWGTAERFD